jgi:aminobenzoyl-glutamate utilization protein B
MMDRKAIVTDAWNDIEESAWRTSQKIWAEPELGLMEIRASHHLKTKLLDNGFKQIWADESLPTAFSVGTEGTGPTVGILLEYDALPGLANVAKPKREVPQNQILDSAGDIFRRIGASPGHGCGHNLIAGANLGAAVAASNAANKLELEGRIVVLGCPAEEIVTGKVAMLELGAFEGIDVLLTSHGDYQNGVPSRPCLAVSHGEVIFRGRQRHLGSAGGNNSTDAATVCVQIVQQLRNHYFPEVGIESLIHTDSWSPNVAPEQARVWFYVRHVDSVRANRCLNEIFKIAHQVALTTGVEVKTELTSACKGYFGNSVMAELMQSQLQTVGPPEYSSEDLDWMSDLCREITNTTHQPDFQNISRIEPSVLYGGVDPYGQDDGEVSWEIPLGRVNWAVPSDVPLHHWAMTALSGAPAGWRGAVMAGKCLALSAVELLADIRIIEASQSEIRDSSRQVHDRSEPGIWKKLSRDPEAYWLRRLEI